MLQIVQTKCSSWCIIKTFDYLVIYFLSVVILRPTWKGFKWLFYQYIVAGIIYVNLHQVRIKHGGIHQVSYSMPEGHFSFYACTHRTWYKNIKYGR
jgi:hypothetical protein